MKSEEQFRRIAHYEALYNDLSEAAAALDRAIERFEALRPAAADLETYYTGKQWKRDFADDEAGRLPEDLPRGVLSEDGLYDLLADVDRLNRRLGEDAEGDL